MSDIPPLIQTIDSVTDVSTAVMLHRLLAERPGWKWGHRSRPNSKTCFWSKSLSEWETDPLIGSLRQAMVASAGSILGRSVKVKQFYANGLTAGLVSEVHRDDPDEGYTMLYYPHSMAEHEGGDTVFFDADREVIRAVRPLQDTAVLFDARIFHVGRAPTDAFRGLRITVAMKLRAEGDSTS